MSAIRDQGWLILNGRCKGDAMGSCTYDNRGAKSTLDYIIVDEGTEADMKVMSDTTIIADGHAMIIT